jgi:hypothetical protein
MCHKLFLIQQGALVHQASPTPTRRQNGSNTNGSINQLHTLAQLGTHPLWCYLSRSSLLLEATRMTACAVERAYGSIPSRPTHVRTDETI